MEVVEVVSREVLIWSRRRTHQSGPLGELFDHGMQEKSRRYLA